MANTIYANAYKEVLIVLNNLVKEDYEKIPKEYIEFLEKNANPDYDFKYDTSKSFEEQELLDDTKYILFGIFEKFGATEIQKEKIKSFYENYNKKLEEEKRKKYNPEDIFKNKNNDEDTEKLNNAKNVNINSVKENIQMIEYKKKKWYQKIFEKILNLFRKK
jgi:hypothetical protein